MHVRKLPSMSRRDAIKAGLAVGAAATLGRAADLLAAPGDSTGAPITRRIPSTGEEVPVIGLGTNAYGVTDPAEIAARREVLQRMSALGGRVIDTARAYGDSEVVIGRLLAELGNRKDYFLASKTPTQGDVSGGARVVEDSFKRLQTERIDLMQVHNLHGIDELVPVLREFKQSGKIRYVGITTSQDSQYEPMLDAMRKHSLDFIQVDYSLGNRGAADHILPLAQERGIAVLVNMPLGGRRGNLLAEVGAKPVPAWAAAELDARSWAQLLLKYVVSHPAVTAAIPGTTKLKHAEDNQAAGRGRLPDAAMRKRIEEAWGS